MNSFCEIGKYHYCRRGTGYAVYQCVALYPTGGGSFKKIDSFATRDEARNEVYRLNGWGTPKNN